MATVEVDLTVTMIVVAAMEADTVVAEVAMMIRIAALATMIDADMAVVTTMALVESIAMLLEAVMTAMADVMIVAAATTLLTVTADAVADTAMLRQGILMLEAQMTGIRVGRLRKADDAGLFGSQYDSWANAQLRWATRILAMAFS